MNTLIGVLIAGILGFIQFNISILNRKVDKLSNHLSDFAVLKKLCPLLSPLSPLDPPNQKPEKSKLEPKKSKLEPKKNER